MARTPSPASQLKAALVKIDDLEKKLKSETESKDRWFKDYNTAKAEIDQAHALLDALPGAPSRKTEPDATVWPPLPERALMTRLAGYLALRKEA